MAKRTVPLILASGSPRRCELMGLLGHAFTVTIPNILEKKKRGESALAYSKRNAYEKALAVQRVHPKAVIVSADTIVVIDGRVLEKPADPAEARKMLKMLSGKTHQVITAFVVASSQGMVRKAVKTLVTFRKITDKEITTYLKTGESFDKSGAYAAQGIGSKFVKSVRGSYTNVIGLPLAEVSVCLEKVLP